MLESNYGNCKWHKTCRNYIYTLNFNAAKCQLFRTAPPWKCQQLVCIGTNYAHYTGGIVCMSSSTSTVGDFSFFFFLNPALLIFFSPETVVLFLLTQSSQAVSEP